MSKILELAKRIASTGGLETKTTETISGTYDSAGQQRLLSHAYTIGANLTITNGELILSRLADNGTGMTVEFGSDVTLTGDGTLMLGDLGQGQPNQDFSASRITGTLPSTVLSTGMVRSMRTYTNSTEKDLVNAQEATHVLATDTKLGGIETNVLVEIALPYRAEAGSGMWTVPVLQIKYGSTESEVLTGSNSQSGRESTVHLKYLFTGISAGAYDVAFYWRYTRNNHTTSSRPFNKIIPGTSVDGRMDQSVSVITVTEIVV